MKVGTTTMSKEIIGKYKNGRDKTRNVSVLMEEIGISHTAYSKHYLMLSKSEKAVVHSKWATGYNLLYKDKHGKLHFIERSKHRASLLEARNGKEEMYCKGKAHKWHKATFTVPE